jgi:hypothetical protein
MKHSRVPFLLTFFVFLWAALAWAQERVTAQPEGARDAGGAVRLDGTRSKRSGS